MSLYPYIFCDFTGVKNRKQSPKVWNPNLLTFCDLCAINNSVRYLQKKSLSTEDNNMDATVTTTTAPTQVQKHHNQHHRQ